MGYRGAEGLQEASTRVNGRAVESGPRSAGADSACNERTSPDGSAGCGGAGLGALH